VPVGEVGKLLQWRCAFGHDFMASPRLVLTAGHWCPRCVRDSAGYPRQAERNQFLAQVEEPWIVSTGALDAVTADVAAARAAVAKEEAARVTAV